jgi:hypothetical protein
MPSQTFRERGEAIRSALVAGLSVADAACEHHVSPRTIERWLASGRRDADSAYAPFARAVDEARAERGLPPRDGLPLDAAELRLLVARAARRGNVHAMKLAAALLATDDEGGDDDLGF